MIFVAFGGSGSSYLLNSVKKCYKMKCHKRPDVYFLPDFWPKKLKKRQFLNEKGYQNFPTNSTIQEFYQRSGYLFDKNKTINENILNYVNSVQENKLISLLTMSAYWGFFSSNKIKNIYFIIRHPLHCYCSWTKKERHEDHVKDMGGKHNEKSIKFFSKIWNGISIEYIKCKYNGLNPKILRYEFIFDDLKEQPESIKNIFNGWDSTKRNYNILNEEEENLLLSLTSKFYQQIYEGKDI